MSYFSILGMNLPASAGSRSVYRVQHTDNPSIGWAQPRRYQPKGSGRATNDTELVGFLTDRDTLEIEISGERLRSKRNVALRCYVRLSGRAVRVFSAHLMNDA
jgi:hypothetical protein